jgi:hypothetical protein
MEEEKDIWKKMDGQNCIFLYKAHVWRICVCDKISKYDKRDDIKSIFVQPV